MTKSERRFWRQFITFLAGSAALGILLGLTIRASLPVAPEQPVETPAPVPTMRDVETKTPAAVPVLPLEEKTPEAVAEAAPIEVLESVEADEPAPNSEPVLVPVSEPEPEPTPAYSARDLELLALVIYQEAGADACSDITRRMVGEVALNRVADWRFPDTLYGVLVQRAQYGRFYWTDAVWPERAALPQEAHAVVRAYEIAEQVLTGDRLLPTDTVYQAEFTQGTEVVAHQDGIYFCR